MINRLQTGHCNKALKRQLRFLQNDKWQFLQKNWRGNLYLLLGNSLSYYQNHYFNCNQQSKSYWYNLWFKQADQLVDLGCNRHIRSLKIPSRNLAKSKITWNNSQKWMLSEFCVPSWLVCPVWIVLLLVSKVNDID